MTLATFDVAAVRARFSALDRGLAFFDGPAGTQVPDEVIDAIGDYLRRDSANLSDPSHYETARRTHELVETAHTVGGRFLGCSPDEAILGANMTTLNFALSRAAARELRPGDEIVATRLDHDGSIAPWLELARDRDLVVRFADVDAGCQIDLDNLQSLLSERTRVVAFPLASNAVGTLTDVERIVELAHGAGALAWADAVHYAAHLPVDVTALGVDVLLCSPYKFYGPHLGLAFARQELLERWRPYKVRPAPESPAGRRYETGTAAHELHAGFVAAVSFIESVGWDAIHAQERTLGERFLAGLPDRCRLYGPPTMDGRVSTFGFTVAGHTPLQVSAGLGARDVAVGYGDFYAVELPRRLELPDGLVRAGILHYNTADEVDRLLTGLDELV
ncbi:MAG: cysteine desulfurase-like protein [Gaiellaceae bacterium]